MSKFWKRGACLLMALAMLLSMTACGGNHVDKEVKELCRQTLAYTDAYLKGESDVMVTYTSLLAVYTYWDGLDIETTKYTVTKNFQAKSMLRNLIESFARQASGEDTRAAILRQRNSLAEIAGLPKLKAD